MKKAAQTVLLSLAILAISAQAAFAGDNGQGWIGEANDKIVTFFGLGIVIIFPLVALIGSYIQGRLERRADERKSAIFKHR